MTSNIMIDDAGKLGINPPLTFEPAQEQCHDIARSDRQPGNVK
jgi:hypothetical protein